jgi:hypothetical protein
MLFEEDDIKRQRGAMARGEYVDPDPLPEDLEIPDGVLLVSQRQLFAEVYCVLLRSCDFGEPDDEAELLMRTANLLVVDDEDDVPLFCPMRTLDLFSVINFVLVLLLRGVEVDNREQFYDFLEAMAAEQFSGELTPWIDQDREDDAEDQTTTPDDMRSD